MFPLYIFVGPSGAGKDTLVDRLRAEFNIPFLVGYTSRQPREGEIPGKTMHFRTAEEMQTMRDAGEFVVPTVYCGNHYGTAIADIDRAMKDGPAHVCILDVGGTMEFVKRFPGCVVIYVTPSSHDVLVKRLRARDPNISDETLAARTEKSIREMMLMEEHMDKIPRCCWVVNDDLETAYGHVREAMRAFSCTPATKREATAGI